MLTVLFNTFAVQNALRFLLLNLKVFTARQHRILVSE